MDPSRLKKSVTFSGITAALTFANFTRLTGIENIRAIHIVSLLACGMALGIFLFSAIALFRLKNK